MSTKVGFFSAPAKWRFVNQSHKDKSVWDFYGYFISLLNTLMHKKSFERTKLNKTSEAPHAETNRSLFELLVLNLSLLLIILSARGGLKTFCESSLRNYFKDSHRLEKYIKINGNVSDKVTEEK